MSDRTTARDKDGMVWVKFCRAERERIGLPERNKDGKLYAIRSLTYHVPDNIGRTTWAQALPRLRFNVRIMDSGQNVASGMTPFLCRAVTWDQACAAIRKDAGVSAEPVREKVNGSKAPVAPLPDLRAMVRDIVREVVEEMLGK